MFNKNYLGVFVAVLLLISLMAVYAEYKTTSRMAAVETPTVTGQATYQCADGHTVKAVFTKRGPEPTVVPGEPPVSNAFVALSFDGAASLSLPQALSADGARYANPDESLVFWSKGSGAMVLENGRETTYKNCIVVKDDSGDLTQVYLNEASHFTLSYPEGYTLDEAYTYEGLGPDVSISGVKLTVPATLVEGTNLSADSYISVERRDDVYRCAANDFLPLRAGVTPRLVEGNDFNYSVASSTEAAVGNRYLEYVYALTDTNPCIAIRYYVHYSVLENYDPGTVTEFDKGALLAQFDMIRQSITLDAPLVPTLALATDAYPLYADLGWQAVTAGEWGDLKGLVVKSESLSDITDIAGVTQPFLDYYADLLTDRGWQEDIEQATAGPGSAVIVYKKDDDYVVLQYSSSFEVGPADQPAQCPCEVQFSIFTGS